MKNSKNVGIILVVLGLLLICAVCPLALNQLVFMATSGGRAQDIIFLYNRAFSLLGLQSATGYVIAAQESCATLLAVVTLVIGVMLALQSRDPGKKKKAD